MFSSDTESSVFNKAAGISSIADAPIATPGPDPESSVPRSGAGAGFN